MRYLLLTVLLCACGADHQISLLDGGAPGDAAALPVPLTGGSATTRLAVALADAGVDAAPPDAGSSDAETEDAGCVRRIYESAGPPPGMPAPASGIDLSDGLWIGWRFEVDAGTRLEVTEVGYWGTGSALPYTYGVVLLDGPDDYPDDLLDGYDTRFRESAIGVPHANPSENPLPVDAPNVLRAGWHAVLITVDAVTTAGSVRPTVGSTPLHPAWPPPYSYDEATGLPTDESPELRIWVAGCERPEVMP